MRKDIFGTDVLDPAASAVARLLADADVKPSQLPGGRTALKAQTLLHRRPVAAIKKPAAEKGKKVLPFHLGGQNSVA